MTKCVTTLGAIRAMQIWVVLICAARDKKSYTYEDIASIVGGAPRRIGIDLDPIYKYCKDPKDEEHPNGYPKLAILVVNKSGENKGMPNPTGMPEVNKENVNKYREEVFKFNWFAIKKPQIGDFEQYSS